MADVTVYGFPLSTFVRTVRWALAEKGVSYDLEPHIPQSPEQLAVHPFGKVPAFRHGEVHLFETVGIAVYVDLTFEGLGLQPSDPVEQARMWQWVSAYNDSFYPAAGTCVIERLVAEDMMGRPADAARLAEAAPKVRKAAEVWDAALAGRDYLAGAALSIADMMAAPMVFYLRLPGVPEGTAALDGLANLARWYDAIAARPAFQATEP